MMLALLRWCTLYPPPYPLPLLSPSPSTPPTSHPQATHHCFQDFTTLPFDIQPRGSLLWRTPAFQSYEYGSFGVHPVVGEVRFGKCSIIGLSFGYFFQFGSEIKGPVCFTGEKNADGWLAAAPQRMTDNDYLRTTFQQVSLPG